MKTRTNPLTNPLTMDTAMLWEVWSHGEDETEFGYRMLRHMSEFECEAVRMGRWPGRPAPEPVAGCGCYAHSGAPVATCNDCLGEVE